MKNLELLGMIFLRVEKRCIIVTRERTLRWSCGQPDIMGVTEGRALYEIEIKRSASDFRADFKKHSRRNRDLFQERMPKLFYYLMPIDLAEKVENEIPDWAGLLVPDEAHQSLNIWKLAPINKVSHRVNLKECVNAVKHQTNFILALERDNQRFRSQFLRGDDHWIDPNSELSFEI